VSSEKHAEELLARIRVHGAIPRHVAIIMDGNGRWARERLLPRPLGHRSGMKSVRAVVEGSLEAGVEWLSLFAFSQENWQRPATEVGALMSLLEEYIAREVDELRQKGVRVRVLGDLERLTPAAAAAVERVMGETAHNDRLTLNLFISYGSRAEIVRAARLLAHDVAEGRLAPDDIDEDAFAARLYTADCPDPDLLIRTSGELRVSNFLLWQIAYTELYISRVLWPDFDRRELFEAVLAFQNRERRFGRVSA
jgi:undecaprenyl diphosphate synthase